MVGAHQNLKGLRDLTTPISGMLCHLWGSICYRQVKIPNLPTKFEVSISTHYEDMTGDTKF